MDVYLISKKQIERTGLILDYGFFSVAEVFVDSRIAPGDVVMYGTPERLQSNDIVLVCWPDKDAGLRIAHMTAASFGAGGTVEVKDLVSGKMFQTTTPYILGRVVYTMKFDTPDWRDVMGRLMPDTMLLQRLQALQAFYEKNAKLDGREDKLLEVGRRLAILAKSSRAP
jgi:hypothetical protein